MLPALMGLCPVLMAQSDYATPYAFTTFAGGGAIGDADGNQLIRKITSAGVVTTLAGSANSSGVTDGTGAVAQFNEPSGVAVGSGGDIYVADTFNHTIRKVTSAGVVTTLAGTPGTAGLTNGTGTAALFDQPYGIAIDGSGNLYVTELGNDTIRKVTSAGVVTTFAGTFATAGSLDGAGTTALFNEPIGIAIDGSGNLYVADAGNDTIRKVTSAGVVSTIAGSAGQAGTKDGAAAIARFNSPRGISVDGSGNLYVADSANGIVREITSAGVVTTLAGSPGSFASGAGIGANAFFDVPVATAVDSKGNVYVTNNLGNTISIGAAATAIPVQITEQPASQTIANGSTVVFQAPATGLPVPTYAWSLNGAALANGGAVSGATGPTLVITGATSANAGSYACTVSNASGSVPSSTATLAVSTTPDIGRLINLSCRAQVGTGADILIAGFAVGGAGTTGSEPLLVRGSGPALAAAPFDISTALPDPHLQFFTGSTLLASNFGWGGNTQVASTAASVGAFPWSNASSLDSALVESEPVGTYTAQINGDSGDTGVALVEIYDATPTYVSTSPRLTNISARVQVGTGGNVLIAGFVIGGSTSKTVLVRASGPALAVAPFSLTGTLPDPELQVFSGSTVVASNTGWGGNAEIALEASTVGAFTWSSATSADSAVLVTLPPGAYTAQVSGASGDTGIGLVEVYEVP